MPEVVVTEFMDRDAVTALHADFDVLADETLATDRTRLLGSVSDARALVVRNRTKVDSELLDATPRLRVVARLGVGLDNIDVAACRERGVHVAPATGANTIAVAEYVIGALLTLARGVFHRSRDVIAGYWPRDHLRGGEVAGKRLGLVGFGEIARAVAARASTLEMEIAGHDPYLDSDDPEWGTVTPLDLDTLLATSDAVSVHVPLTGETRHLVDERAIATMRQGALMVNTSRGGVVDESAVVAALSAGRLGGAALDVFENEPLDETSGAMFAAVPNLILTPHIAGITRESEVRVGGMAVAAVREHLKAGT